MPRITAKKPDYLTKDLANAMSIHMKAYGISQQEAGAEIGVKQSAFSQRLATGKFNTKELIKLFALLKFTDEEILRYMGGMRKETKDYIEVGNFD